MVILRLFVVIPPSQIELDNCKLICGLYNIRTIGVMLDTFVNYFEYVITFFLSFCRKRP